MALLPIVTYPDPVLATEAETVEEITDEIRMLIRDMAETMYAAPGVGLAANQVGVTKRVIVMDLADPEVHKGLIALVNPEIVERSGHIVWEEGCLSLPGVNEDVERSNRVKVKALDADGNEVEYQAEGFLAVAFQHEIDHLKGTLLLDRLSSLKRNLLKRKLKKEKQALAEEG